MLQVEQVQTYYGDSHVLHGVSLNVQPGEVVAVLGRNGVGKTTLVRSVMGLTPPRSGRVHFHGADITREPTHRRAMMGIGLVPQGRRVFPSLTVLEHLQVTRRSRGAARWTLERVLELFPNLWQRRGHYGTELSGGEQQMLAVGRALVANPDMLIMDEPTEGLAPLMVGEVERMIRALKEARDAVLLIEQRVSFALELADRIYVMSKGAIVMECTPGTLAADTTAMSRYLGV